jgi:hypothetical protein
MKRRSALPLLLATAATIAGCAEAAMENVRRDSGIMGGIAYPTRYDVIASDVKYDYRHPRTADDGRRSADWGESALAQVKQADPTIRTFVEEHGLPEGIAIYNDGLRIALFYLGTNTEYVFDTTSPAGQEIPKRSLVATVKSTHPIACRSLGRNQRASFQLSWTSRRPTARAFGRLPADSSKSHPNPKSLGIGTALLWVSAPPDCLRGWDSLKTHSSRS